MPMSMASDKSSDASLPSQPDMQAQSYANRASVKFLRKDIMGAISDFNLAISLNPSNADFYLNRGYLKHIINDYNGAMRDYNSALKINKI